MRKHSTLFILFVWSCIHTVSATVSADSLNRLDEVVVTSSAAPKAAVSTAPLRMVDDRLIQRSGITEVSEALHRMPGVTLRDYGGAGGLKTVSVRGFGAGHTGVSYDGVPLSDVQSGQIDLSRYSVDNVRSISLVIGDNDDIFIPARMAASAATVNITTMPVVIRPEVSAKFRAGSFGYINPFIRVSLPLSEKVAAGVAAEFIHADNDYPFTLVNGDLITRERRNNSRMNSGHGELNLSYDINDNTSLTTKIYYYTNSRRLPGPVVFYNDVNHERLKEQNAMAQARLMIKPASKLSLKVYAKYNFASSKYHDTNGNYPGGRIDQNYWQREIYSSAALLYTPTESWLFDYSADYIHNSLNSNLVSDTRPYRNSWLQSATAKYRHGSMTAMARLLMSVYRNGAKEGEAAGNQSRLSPSLSLSWQPVGTQLLFVRASYKNIFRVPTFNELYFEHYGSKDVEPETTDQYNIGATYTLRPAGPVSAGTFTIDGYINNIRDMIVAVPYNMFVWRIINLGKVRTYGLDVTADITLTAAHAHDITLSANYSLQRSMPVTDPQSSDWHKQVAYIPLHSGTAMLCYENPWANISVTATAVSHRYTTSNNLPATRIAGYAECSASLWRQFRLSKHLFELRADIINILDKQYCIVARYPMPGRHYRITLTYNI